MRSRSAVVCAALAVALVFAAGSRAHAQDEPPRIGPFVVDVRGTVPKFTDELQLALSRGLQALELPGWGFGLDVGAHVYVLRWRAITFGLGGQLTLARARFEPPSEVADQFRAVTERLTSIAPQISFNFGTGNGWSYISGGIGPAVWSVVPDGAEPGPADEEQLTTINYGGGARWFARPHLAFTFDVRFYAINPGTPTFGRPGGPRTTMLIMGAGVSFK